MADSSTAVFVRRVEFDDQGSIQALVSEEAQTLERRYGNFDLTNMIELASLGITAVDDTGAVVGFAAFFDYPYLNVDVEPAAWPGWLQRKFKSQSKVSPANSTWLSFFVANPLCQTEVAENVVRTAFTTLPDVTQIFLALPEDVRLFAPLKDTFERVQGADAADTAVSLFSCPRSLYLPELFVRAAKVEDHDDLVPVFESQSEVLSERYGEFFIAEVIAQQDEANRALVAEMDGRAIGLIGCSSDINVKVLQEHFELDPFDGLLSRDQQLAQAAEAAKRQAEQLAGEALTARAKAEEAAQAEAEAEEGDGDAADGVAEQLRGVAIEAQVAADKAKAEAAAAVRKSEGALACNAFAISVFCIDEAFESRTRELLMATFALYEKQQYAILTLPHSTSEFPLLSCFSRIELQPSSSFGHLLYVLHREALYAEVSVRPALTIDETAVFELVNGLEQETAMRDAFRLATGPPAKGGAEPAEPAEPPAREVLAFVAESSSQVIGLLLVRPHVHVEMLQSQYSLEDFVLFSEHQPEQHLELAFLVINPIFARSARFAIKEVFRLQNASCMYYKLKEDLPIPEAIDEFVQVRPRSQVVIPPDLTKELDEEHALVQSARGPGAPPALPAVTPYASEPLYFITRRLISEPRIVNNTRIVVVGASDTALALLEALLSVPYLLFTSIVLIAPHGSELLRHPRGSRRDGEAAPFFRRSCSYSAEELRALNLGARVKVIQGRIVDMNRQHKTLELPDGSLVPYDYLVFAPELSENTLLGLGPDAVGVRGAFSVADEDAVLAICDFVESEQLVRKNSAIVVHGSTLESLCAIEALLSRGISAKQILLVLPRDAEGEPAHDCLGEPVLVERMHAQLEAMGVSLHRGLQLMRLEADDDQLLSAALFETAEQSVAALPCALLLCCAKREIERSLFRTMNDNSIVYDGGLVVSNRFCTNDAAVFAAGAIVKFSRRYRCKQPLHLCSGREAGEKLAKAMLPTLDSLSPLVEADAPLPTFSRPLCEAACLPGGLYYMHAAMPRVGCADYAALKAHPSFGRELITDRGGLDGYTSVRLDRFGIIQSFVYLGREPLPETNWMRMLGMPESALNHLSSRFDEQIVHDLPAFLRENWAMALFHDRFDEFTQALHQELGADEDFARVLKEVEASASFKEGKVVSAAEFIDLLPESKRSLVRARLLDYVQTNQNQLNMYLVPSSRIMDAMEKPAPLSDAIKA